MSGRLRVCHLVLSLQPGGLENGVVNVVNGLDPGRFRSTVCCLQTAGEFRGRLRAGVPVEVLGHSGGNDPKLPFRLARHLRRERIDIVHSRNPESFFYGAVAARLAGTGLVHSEHGRIFPERPLRARAQRWLSVTADATFAVSERLRDDLIRELGLDPARIEVIHNGVDTEAFRAAERTSAGGFVIGSVGRLAAVKNYALLLQALARLAQLPGWRMMLVGDGEERAALEGLARELGIAARVEFTGHCSDIPAKLRSMDVFVLPSRSEGLSNTLLEAMASGVAPLVSDVGGNREVIRNGIDGLLFSAQDLHQLTRELAGLIASAQARARLAAAAMRRVHAEFSLSSMLSRYSELYARVADRRAVRGPGGRSGRA